MDLRIFLLLTYICLPLTNGLNSDLPISSSESATSIIPENQVKKVNILQNDICSKCKCDAKNKLFDCNGKLSSWLSPAEWDILQNGDVIFDTIDLQHNNFTKVPILPTYPVKNLYLSYNEISEIALGAFQNLSDLLNLDLSHNKISSKAMEPDVFRGNYMPGAFLPLANLRSLNLSYNDLHNLDPDTFMHTPNIEELILCKNTFQVIDHETYIAISGLRSLKKIDLSYMELSELPETFLHGPRGLETLILSGNLLNEVPECLKLAASLKSLVLDENRITDLDEDNSFPDMGSLQYLSISYMPKLSNIGRGSLSKLQNLTTLVASDNPKLSHIDSYALARNNSNHFEYPPLQKLYLNNNNLTYFPKLLIEHWDKVTILDLRFNPWTCTCLNDWLINFLMENINITTPVLTNEVQCGSPDNLNEVGLLTLYSEHTVECSKNFIKQDSLIWIGLIVGILIGIPMSLAGFVLYKRGCFGLMHRNQNIANRALYNRANFNEDFYI